MDTAPPQRDPLESPAKRQCLSMQSERNVSGEVLREERAKLKELEKLERERKKEENRKIRQEEKERREAERLAKKEEREKKEAERLAKREEERVKREEKKKKLEEEKRVREEKKAELKQKREEEKRKKDEERRLKEEERRQKEEEKKQREQEKKQREQEKKQKEESKQRDEERQLRISSFFTMKKKEDTKDEAQSPYQREFLPFFQKTNVVMAPIVASSDSANFDFSYSLKKRHYAFTEELVEALSLDKAQAIADGLAPLKYLSFYENSKPPFSGTWSSKAHLEMPLGPENPLDTAVTGMDYTYDSDLDWQEEEGDDVDEDDEDDEEDEEDDMDDFVERTEQVRAHVGPLVPLCVWNSPESTAFAQFHNGVLDLKTTLPIEPFPEKKRTAPILVNVAMPKVDATNVLTPRKVVITDEKALTQLRDFIAKNSDYSIGTLLELAKKQFPAFTKSILKHTIQEIAVYDKKRGTWEPRLSQPA